MGACASAPATEPTKPTKSPQKQQELRAASLPTEKTQPPSGRRVQGEPDAAPTREADGREPPPEAQDPASLAPESAGSADPGAVAPASIALGSVDSGSARKSSRRAGNLLSSGSSGGSARAGGSARKEVAQAFTLKEMKQMTRDFAASAKLGQGGYGPVYRGQMPDGRAVAVKVLESDNGQGQREWECEVRLLEKLEHPNLVCLVGYCSHGESRRDLVYEFMQNGSLDQWIFDGAREPIPWDSRMKIALHAARGLAFLHEAPGGAIIFRDLKPANILLDGDFNAKLSDFGMAREGPEAGKAHVSTRIIGTSGYAAPEYTRSGHLTVKTDTYTYGIVLLEIVTGRPSIDVSRPEKEQELIMWLLPFLEGEPNFAKIVDPRLDGKVSMKALRKSIALAVHCIKPAESRPSMNEVVRHLEKIQGLYAKEVANGTSVHVRV